MSKQSRSSSNSALQLERVLGLTTQSNAAFASSDTGDIFYATGCFAVRYHAETNRQKSFYKATKAISAIAVSDCGRYLALGERGLNPYVIIWDLHRSVKLAQLEGHKGGVGCLAFSPGGGKYLVTIGFKSDRQLLFWDWKTAKCLSKQRLGNKVHAISYHDSGDFFVTAGDRHLKWWLVEEILDGEAIQLQGKAASILEGQKNSVFMDVCCGANELEARVFCTSSTGVLCVFNEERMLEKWVQLESPSSYSLELFCDEGTPGLLLVGCADGVVRSFSPETLQYIATLPTPAPLFGANPSADTGSHAPDGSTGQYAATVGMRKVAGSADAPVPKLSVIYADRSLFVWDISDIYSVVKYRSFVFHRSCIWDLQFIENSSSESLNKESASDTSATRRISELPERNSFVTCSADNTIRIWNIDSKSQRRSKFRSVYSREMLHVIDLSTDRSSGDDNENSRDMLEVGQSIDTSAIASTVSAASTSLINANDLPITRNGEELELTCGILDTEMPFNRTHSSYSPRALAIHPYARHLACGDKTGHVKVFDLSTMQLICSMQAHAAEVLTLDYSPVMASYDNGESWCVQGNASSSVSSTDEDEQRLILLATAGRDRLIHIFDASTSVNSTNDIAYEPINTLDNHTSSVTIVRFTSDGRRLLSCGGDRSLVFNNVHGTHVNHMKSIQTSHGTINGMTIEASAKFAVTSGQDKRLNIWNLNSGKHTRAYKSDQLAAELYKNDVDPSGMYIATCAFDKTITLFDFFSGELITQVSGHSELVTGVKFSPDGRYLLSCGGDGCIMMWRVADILVQAMQDRLVELIASAKRRNLKATAAVHKSHTRADDNTVLPQPPAKLSIMPPAPPSSEQIQAEQQQNDSVFMPPPPPTLVEEGKTIATKGVINSSGAHRILGAESGVSRAERMAALSKINAASKSSTTDSKSSISSSRQNQWAARIDQDQGYELFGKKIKPAAEPSSNRNKFTLELTGTAHAEVVNATSTEVANSPNNNLASTLEAKDEVMLHDSDEEGGDDDDENKCYNFAPQSDEQDVDDEQTYEDDFEDPSSAENAAVIHKSSPDKERNKSKNMKDAEPDSAGSTTVMEVSTEEDNDLENTSTRVDELERTAQDLETWLEEMIRGEGSLDETVSHTLRKSLKNMKERDEKEDVTLSSTASTEVFNSTAGKSKRKVVKRSYVTAEPSMVDAETNLPDEKNDAISEKLHVEENNSELRQSLSAAYFQRKALKPAVENKTVKNDISPASDDGDAQGEAVSPTKPSTMSPTRSPVINMESRRLSQERKQRETAASVAIMQEKLKAMGGAKSNDQHVSKAASPSKKNEVVDPDYDSADTVSNDEYDTPTYREHHRKLQPPHRTPEVLAKQLKEKTESYKKILLDLEMAKKRASESYMELTMLRSSLGQSLLHRKSSEAVNGTTNDNQFEQGIEHSTTSSMNDSLSTIPHINDSTASESALFGASIAEADQLLGQFRESFLSLPHSEGLGRQRFATTDTSTYHQQSGGKISSRTSTTQPLDPIDRETYCIQEGEREHSATVTSTSSAAAASVSNAVSDEPSVAELTAVLDKYSDKLVDLLGEKLLHKLNSSQQSNS